LSIADELLTDCVDVPLALAFFYRDFYGHAVTSVYSVQLKNIVAGF
jgi:hypothetical protein